MVYFDFICLVDMSGPVFVSIYFGFLLCFLNVIRSDNHVKCVLFVTHLRHRELEERSFP